METQSLEDTMDDDDKDFPRLDRYATLEMPPPSTPCSPLRRIRIAKQIQLLHNWIDANTTWPESYRD
ncbi:hypothetical protein CSQ94_13775 [Janthinobacterium sp. BJB312]|nr:hypothetical protein CSQ94_13775 [Janthinobacterium sp. BJB312]